MYRVKLERWATESWLSETIKRIDEERMPKPSQDKAGWWTYYAEP